jgi:hypothetical protein
MINKFALWCACSMGVFSCGFAAAQNTVFGNPKPLSTTGGYAAQEMRSIYRGAIGTGYSVNSLSKQMVNRDLPKVPNVGQASARGSRIDSGLAAYASGSKPFGNYSPAPTVSPYLNLFREDLDGESDLNYQTLVQPQLRQQAINERQQRDSMAMAQRLQAIGAQSDFNPAGSRAMPATGHQTVFMYYGHYYPAMNRGRR